MAFLSAMRHRSHVETRRVTLFDLLALYRQRRALARLDASTLADIGLNRKAAQDEAHRPLWDVPRHWIG